MSVRRERTSGKSEPPLHRAQPATARHPAGFAPLRARTRPALLVALIAITHGTIDGYVAFLHPLLPRIMSRLGLSIAVAAILVTTLSIASSLLQPLFGYLADRHGRRAFLAAGPLVSGVFLSMIGVAPSVAVLLVFLALGGLGSAAFHPPGASMVARAADGRGSGVRLSVFSFGGAAGYAAGPLVAVGLVALVGMEGMWIAFLPGALLSILLWRALGRAPADPSRRPPPSPGRVLRLLRGPLGIVFGVSALAAFVQRTFLTLSPIISADAGASEAAGAVVISLYLGAQAFGTLLAGVLTDRIDRRALIGGSMLLALPVHVLAFLAVPAGPLAFGAAMAAGFLNIIVLPPIVVMAQEIVPEGVSASSGIVMGLAWAVGSLGIPFSGALGDAIGPAAAAAWSMPVLLVGAALALHPSLRPFRRPGGTREPGVA